MTHITGIYGIWDYRLPGEGIKGNGKTLTGVYYLYQDYMNGISCFSNIGTTFTERMTTQEVFDIFRDKSIHGVSILLDEIQKDINSRSGTTSPKLIKEFCNIAGAQTRKKDVNLYWTAQRAMDVDLRLRVQTDYLLHPVRIHADKTPCSKLTCEKTHYIAVYSMEPMIIKPIKFLSCQNVGKLYDTKEVITDGIEV